jgi:hypothetical protein
MQVAFHPRALLITIPLLFLLWFATDLRWPIGIGMAGLVYDWLSFAGVVAPAAADRRR